MPLTLPPDLRKTLTAFGVEIGLAVIASLEKHVPAVDFGKATSTIQMLAPVFLLKCKEWLEGHHAPATPEAAATAAPATSEEVAPG